MIDQKLADRVIPALPPGERFVTAFEPHLTTHNGDSKPYAPDHLRPEIFPGLRMPGDGWGSFIGTFGRILINDVLNSPVQGCADPSQRQMMKKNQHVFYGGWGSQAGQLLAACQPRSKAGVVTTVVLTDQGFRVVYVQRRRGSFSKLGQATALGWFCPPEGLAWVREHPAGSGKSYEFGFPDSSWAVLSTLAKDDLRERYPRMLREGANIPW